MNVLTLDSDEFSQLKRAFMGGHTHANAMYVRQVISRMGSQDIISSYSSVTLLEKFPMSRAHIIKDELTNEEFERLLATKACLFDIELTDVRHKLKFEHPIPSSKCWELVNPLTDNGRVVMADKLGTTITEQDFITYKKFYEWSSMKIANFRYYDKQYLPHEFVKAILGLYEKKTTLKDIESELVNYMISKNMLNASYGMIVTDPVRDSYEYDGENCIKVKPVLEEAIDLYNKNVKRFLFYPWGVWVTAYARRNLFKAIEALGDDFVYSDTDSVKYCNPEEHDQFFVAYNMEILDKIERAARFHELPPEAFAPSNKHGDKKTIGVWEFEGIYDKFKTLGAKRYIYTSGDKLSVTLAGANKYKTAEYLKNTGDPFGNFNHNLCIPKEYAGRLTSTYIDDEHEGVMVDYQGIPYHYHELSACHLEASEYNLTMSDEFINYLLGVKPLD